MSFFGKKLEKTVGIHSNFLAFLSYNLTYRTKKIKTK